MKQKIILSHTYTWLRFTKILTFAKPNNHRYQYGMKFSQVKLINVILGEIDLLSLVLLFFIIYLFEILDISSAHRSCMLFCALENICRVEIKYFVLIIFF